MDESKRILAIDYGEKRIGLAMSDPLAIIASGLGTLPNDERALPALLEIIESRNICRIIVGLPLTLRGEEGKSAGEVRKFMAVLRAKTEVPVLEIDERFTSVMAEGTIKEMGIGKKKREKNKGKIDEISAVHLLQGYLQSSVRGS